MDIIKIKINVVGYDELVNLMLNCTKCKLHKSRRRVVPGEGPLNAKIMIIGEAPGEREDEEGRPFVGAAGQLLTKLLNNVGIRREEVYITNVVKCRPPNNRDPEPDEIEACRPYLITQILMIRPQIIICLGRHSAREILTMAGYPEKSVSNISSIRGKVFNVKLGDLNVKVLPTYHPAAALYNPRLRGVIEEDLRKVKTLLGKGEGGGGILDYLGS
ncbi:type-4 uracil-DNA glycosylase [Vulcanisaeta distributa]|uniref:Type-4 uracil-DNA glycosylase n=1 Tax=Vulcanisaeta distributa (strain DSM 14429 / JCM 11212 / NBRC 100878 / IC-017) TaxID=572478 RepID=E1QNN8_VULDI|nr:type-4 uracil-DNA glycosylase [Vulcanisaeta distributa]ADN51326.1 phage SPO1 DNA polymerase-related protein [Vulcanisaeta distributa DSM 14429]